MLLRRTLLSAAVGAILLPAIPAGAAEISGAGATFPYPIYAKWAEAYKGKTGTSLNYQSIGSGGGIAQITAKTVDFGASDMPLKPEELEAKGLVQFPPVIGGEVMAINLPGIKAGEMTLDGPTIADIYLGKITKWNDPAIAKLNPGLKLPDMAIAVVHRSDGSGTTFIFTDYLSKVSPDWKAKVSEGTSVDFPVGLGGKGNEGVSALTSRTVGSIGYVEYAYALQNKLVYTKLVNHDGVTLDAGSKVFQAAAANADWKAAPGFYLILTDQPGKESWPITGATFILMHKQQDHPDRAKEVLTFFDWAYKNGAQMAEFSTTSRCRQTPWRSLKRAGSRLSDRTASRCGPGTGRNRHRVSTGGGRSPAGSPLHAGELRVAAEAEVVAIPQASAQRRPAGHAGDAVFHALTVFFAVLVLVILCGVIISLAHGAWPALHRFGFGFFVNSMWNPVTEKFGALAPIYGTLVTSLIAMLIGIPVAFGVALFITELCPKWLKRPLGTMIELLAAIPSIIYGIWGLFILAPVIQEYVEPALIATLGNIPGFGVLFAGPPLGIGVLTAGFILAIMVLAIHRRGHARRLRDGAADGEGKCLRARRNDD